MSVLNTATFSLTLRSELGDLAEKEDDDMVEGFFTHSPEPQEPVESEAPVQPEESSQPDRLHPEQDLPHIFKVSSSDSAFVRMCSLLWNLNLTLIYFAEYSGSSLRSNHEGPVQF